MRLRDLLPHVLPHRDHRVVVPAEPGPGPTPVALLFPRIDSDSWRSPLCQSGGDVEHARCRHVSNRARFDGCSCPCHAPTSYDDGGDR